MQRHSPLFAIVGDGDFQAQRITQLPLKREDVGIERLDVARARPSHIGGCNRLYGPGTLLSLPHRKPLGDHVLRQCFWIGSGRNSSRVPHTDIASQ